MLNRNKRKSKSVNENGRKTPSPTAQILEHVELLNNSEQSPLDQSAIIEDISRKLESQIEKRFDSIEEQIAISKADLNDDGSHIEGSSFEKLVERFDKIESKLASIEDQLQNTDPQPISVRIIEERFEAIDTRLEKVATVIAGQQLIENRGSISDAAVVGSHQDQFSEMLNQMRNKLASVSQDNESGATNEVSEPDWSQQKQAMLSKYGIDSEHRPDMASPTASAPVLETTIADAELSATIELKTVGEEVSPESEEIQNIRKELNLKLRDAEVRLSIERAMLYQLQAELETKQVELKRRNAEIVEKSTDRESQASSNQGQFSLLDRLKRHLTVKDRTNLDRI